ncbi:MAG: MBL fold metallo-hydrolase [Fuerstiella sp.]|nr:MBL fold metallo-hydrolase [Fuerstiella sp.]MCP4854706.1 MBL fold metallo-hydrolase [Fuerstiella sp.]
MLAIPDRVSVICLSCLACLPIVADEPEASDPYVAVLGIAQDAGFPQAGCRKACCQAAWKNNQLRQHVACLAIVDPQQGQRWLIDCTPDFREQLHALDQLSPTDTTPGLDGILLTHAHIGHYAGLIHLGRETIGANRVPVYAMPRMRRFLEDNGPWEQLIRLRQIAIEKLVAGQPLKLNKRIEVTPFLVPHRDEYSETVGFCIQGPSRTVIYIPDIDKWERWEIKIEDIVADADIAYLDGTFFANGELPGRNMSQIPHPFVTESIERFKKLSARDRDKVRFIHANHTNPILDPSSSATRAVKAAGHHVAEQGERFSF